MGNRAVLCVAPDGNKPTEGINLYLHWNGGPESVLAFCEAAKRLGVRDPVSDDTYAMGRLAQIVGNFFGGTLSMGMFAGKPENGDCSDNGIYGLGKDWTITYRSKEGPKTVEELGDAELKQHIGVLAMTMRNNVAHFHDLPYGTNASGCALVQGDVQAGHVKGEHGEVFIRRAATEAEAQAAAAYTQKGR